MDKVIIRFALFPLLIVTIIGQMSSSNVYAQNISGEPSGSTTLHPFDISEVGIRLKANAVVDYSFQADDRILFDIHSHDGKQIITHTVTESDIFVGKFTAPTDGDYYFFMENLQLKDISIDYNISFVHNSHFIQYEDAKYEIRIISNSDVIFLGFSQENKEISLRIETPYLAPGVANITIPRVLLDGPFTIQGGSAEENYSQDDSSSIFVIKTPNGSHDIRITGTTAVPESPIPLVFLAAATTLLFIAGMKLKFSSGKAYKHTEF
jgi:hypothetical protein